MNFSAVEHYAFDNYCYPLDDNRLVINIKTGFDIERLFLIYGDPFKGGLNGSVWKWAGRRVEITEKKELEHHLWWTIRVEPELKRCKYHFELHEAGSSNIRYYLEDGFYTPDEFARLKGTITYFIFPWMNKADIIRVPEWVKNTVWYQIFPERFANGNALLNPEGTLDWDSSITPNSDDFFGGDLQGIIDHLDYLQDLGITGLYLCPIFESTSNHKYNTTDYFEIDRHFGDKETFRELVNAVFNHIGSQSPQWQDVVKNGEESAYKDWFHIQQFPVTTEKLSNKRDLPYHAFGFEDYMPKLNTANPEVKDYLLKVATYWIEEFDIDAWRLDVANEIDHQFWKDFRKAVLAKKPDLYILGEVWHTSQPWLNGDEFHAVMNYPLSDSSKEYFLRGVKKTDQFINEINGQSMYYKQQISEVMFNLLDSHDTERILWPANEDAQLVKSALAFFFLQKGTPCIYYGTELALTGGPDPDCRRCMPWERVSSDNDMLNFIKNLIKIRKHASAIIQHGKYSLQEIKADVLTLKWNYDNQVIKAIFNQSKEDYLLEKEAVALASNCQELENQLVISPNGFVIF